MLHLFWISLLYKDNAADTLLYLYSRCGNCGRLPSNPLLVLFLTHNYLHPTFSNPRLQKSFTGWAKKSLFSRESLGDKKKKSPNLIAKQRYFWGVSPSWGLNPYPASVGAEILPLRHWAIKVTWWPTRPHFWKMENKQPGSCMTWEGNLVGFGSAFCAPSLHTSTEVEPWKVVTKGVFLNWASASSSGGLSLSWPWNKVASCPRCRVIVRGRGYGVRWPGPAAAP